jgi:ribosomal 30S subunit maturation factor RimM
MSKTKKLDIFNLFYSGAAVVILIGVIAKLLEWPAQDLLITSGLAIEAIVFGVSAIKYVDIKKDTEVATEATLSKVADGLENITANTGGIGGSGSGETYVNVQTGVAANSNIPDSSSSVDSNSSKKLSIDINSNSNNSHTLWQLEQLDILSLAKDLFFQPKWDELSADEYNQLTHLFKDIFDKKLPNKEAILFLVQFPVKLPIPELNKLTIDKEHSLELSDIELLCKAFTLINFNNFFDNFILELKGESCLIRPKKVGDIQVYGGENEEVITHVNNYFNKELIVSPKVECLQSIIKLKGIDSETEASLLSGLSILAFSDEVERDELDFEGYTLTDLLSNTNYTITNVELIPNNILLEFRHGFKDCLLPFSDGIIVSIDHDTQTIQANFPDGILDL